MNWKKNSLLALFGVTALVGVAASASAEDWSFSAFWSPQASYVSHDDGDSYYGRYAGHRDHDRNSDWSYRNYHRDYDRGEHARSYGWSGSYGNGYGYGYGHTGYSNGYDNGYVQPDRGEHQSYGEHRDRDESDDDD